MPAVSVIIPTQNRRAWLDEAIASVQAQTYTDWELIVVEDGGQDGTDEGLAAWSRRDPRIRSVRQPPRGGAAALNRGLQLAGGELVAFLDDDDRWLPGKLDRQVRHLGQHPDEVAVFCLARLMDQHGRVIGRVVPPQEIVPSVETLLQWRSSWVPSLTMVRRRCLVEVGGFDDRLRVGYDRDLWVRVLQRGPIGKLTDVLTERRVHGGNISRSWQAILEDRLLLLGKLRGHAPAGISPRWLAAQVGRIRYQLAWEAYDRGDFGGAARHWSRAIGARPTVGLEMRRGLRPPVYGFLAPYVGVAYAAARVVGQGFHRR